MKKSTKQAWTLMLITLFLAMSGCGIELVDDGSGFLKTGDGQIVQWPEGSRVSFLSDQSVPDEARSEIQNAQNELNSEIQKISINVEVARSSAPPIRNSKDDVLGDGKNGIYFLPEPWPWKDVKGKENSDAMTVIINRGSRIIEADIFYRVSTYNEDFPQSPATTNGTGVSTFALSTTYVNAVTPDQKWTKVAFLHEAMHAIGFTHVNERDSIMYPVVSIGLYLDPFSDLDLERISTLY